MQFRPWYLRALCVLVIPLLTTSAMGGEELFFRNWRVEHGLAESAVIDIQRDDLGFLWIATPYGLNRFDGKRFTWFGRDKDAGPRDLGRNYVNCLAAGSEGDMWIATAAIIHYDASRQAFTTLPIPDTQIIKAIVVDQQRSRVWAGGKRGRLWCFDTNTFALLSTHSIGNHIEAPNPEIKCIQVEPDGRILVGHTHGLAKFDLSPTSYERVTNHSKPVVGLCKDKDETVYFADWRAVYRIDSDGSSTLCDRPIGGIQNIDCDQDGRILIARQLGASIYEPGNDTISAIPTSTNGIAGTLISDKISALHADKHGLVWIGTRHHGLYLLDPRNQNFRTIDLKDKDGAAIRSVAVKGLALDARTNSVYMATAFHGLVRYERTTKKITSWNQKPRETTVGNLPSDQLSSVMIDRAGKIWTSSFSAGVSTCATPQGDFSNPFDAETGIARSAGCVAETKDGRIWLSSSRKPIQILDPIQQRVVQTLDGETGERLNLGFKCICETREHRMWVGSLRGLAEITCRSNQSLDTAESDEYTARQVATPEGNHNVLVIREDKRSDGVLWIGTNIGLWRFDSHQSAASEKHKAWKQITLQTGRARLPVVSLEQDADGDIWAATTAGIFLYEPATRAKHYFDQRNGLKVSAYQAGVSQCDGNTMFFGGAGGVAWFDASDIKESLVSNGSRLMPEIVDVLVNNSPVHPSGPGNRLEKSPILGGAVSLTANDEVFSLRFQSLDFEPQDTARYRYRLEGFSTDWTLAPIGTDVATFTAVPPGDYQFILERISNHRQPSKHERVSVPVNVRAHFWETAWFKTCLVLGSALLIAGLVSFWWNATRRRMEATAMRERNTELSTLNNQLQELVVQKDDLMGIMAHDLRNPLAALSIGFELVQMEDSKAAADDDQLTMDMLSGSVDQMLEIIDRSLLNCREQLSAETALKCELRIIDAAHLAKSLAKDYASVASAKNIRLNVQTPDHDCPAVADDGFARQVLANLLSNAVKFSHPDSSVWVTVSSPQPGSVQIDVRDEGLGLSRDDIQRCFGRFEKLSASPTGQEPSSGLGLYNARKVTESMGGTLTVVSDGKNQGATFTLTLQQPAIAAGQLTDSEPGPASPTSPMVSS